MESYLIHLHTFSIYFFFGILGRHRQEKEPLLIGSIWTGGIRRNDWSDMLRGSQLAVDLVMKQLHFCRKDEYINIDGQSNRRDCRSTSGLLRKKRYCAIGSEEDSLTLLRAVFSK